MSSEPSTGLRLKVHVKLSSLSSLTSEVDIEEYAIGQS